ncbi:hypothetical protein COV18_07245 [Candidatus Woesearchaeota archaeon CG10_big_fil_rev_8_21_14_0_10_37_12]|nr:MAG: hypothetical protein COV18_07245 [Candidatus Woesearchaeota archaeon CG10_big_fil_rev_8_21_14_0_10_37_12]
MNDVDFAKRKRFKIVVVESDIPAFIDLDQRLKSEGYVVKKIKFDAEVACPKESLVDLLTPDSVDDFSGLRTISRFLDLRNCMSDASDVADLVIANFGDYADRAAFETFVDGQKLRVVSLVVNSARTHNAVLRCVAREHAAAVLINDADELYSKFEKYNCDPFDTIYSACERIITLLNIARGKPRWEASRASNAFVEAHSMISSLARFYEGSEKGGVLLDLRQKLELVYKIVYHKLICSYVRDVSVSDWSSGKLSSLVGEEKILRVPLAGRVGKKLDYRFRGKQKSRDVLLIVDDGGKYTVFDANIDVISVGGIEYVDLVMRRMERIVPYARFDKYVGSVSEKAILLAEEKVKNAVVLPRKIEYVARFYGRQLRDSLAGERRQA